MTDESLFAAALEKPTAAERQALLDAVCAGDSAQRQRLDLLLAGHDRDKGILDQSAVLPDYVDRHTTPAVRAGTVLAGRYKLLEEIGEGGMGTVWVAEQTQPVRRKVAVKLVKAGMDSKSVLARFEAERQALAVMDHPSIAKVLDGGTTETGRPFFVMEYVKGVPITTYSDDARLSIADRLALFVPVCQAVQHAHTKGIIHRDLKPSNILVCLYDGRPVPKVIDFGLAKAMHQPLTEHTLHTAHGQMLGTPLYMSPEQAEFNNFDVDTRTDVYALGVVLYELLTGTTPLERDRLRRAAWDEMLRLIREEEPPRPSTRLSGSGSLPSVAAQRQLEPVRLTRLVRGELDWIVMKCLEKDRSRRYDTANGLAQDVQRYLLDEPVEAFPPSAAYRLRKVVRKYRKPLITAAAITGFLLAGVVALSVALVTVNEERRAKEAALDAEGKRRKQTRAALDALSSQITEDWLAKQPALVPQHKRFLEQALRLYEEFLADTGQDEESRAGVAQAYLQVGRIREHLAQWKDAEAAFERSRTLSAALVSDFPTHLVHRDRLAQVLSRLGVVYNFTGRPEKAATTLEEGRTTFKSLADEFPTNAEYRYGLAVTLNGQGLVLKSLNRLSKAESNYAQALDLNQPLVAENPSNLRFRYNLAQTYMNLGILLEIDSRLPDAERAHRQAVEHFTQLAAEFPAPRYTESQAMSRSNLGKVLQAVGNHPEAEKNFRQSLTARRQLVAEFPGVPVYRQGLAITLNNLGILLKDTNRAKEAEEYYGEAAAIHKKLADDFPAVSNHQNEAAGALTNLARLLLVRKDFAGALRLLEEAVPYHKAALKGNKKNPVYRNFYRLNCWRQAEAFLGLKDHIAACEKIVEFFQYTTEPPRDAYTAASLLAGCVRLAIQDERLADAKRQELATRYGDRAMTALRKAVELKAREVSVLQSDTNLNPLREREDFQKLLTELLKSSKPQEVLPPPYMK